jgi:capsid protein
MNLKQAIGIIPAMIGFGIGSVGRGFQAGISGNWEGSERDRRRRRGFRQLDSQDRGLNYGVREDLLSEARALSQTFPIARCINRKYANHVVGSCRLKWNTGDSAVNKIYGDAWQNWMPIADLAGRHHFRKMTKIAVQSILRDGRILGQKDNRTGFFQLSAIEGDRVSSDGQFNNDRDGMVAGFGIDLNGRIKFAKVWERTIYGTFQNPQEIPANQLIHAFDSDRFDAVSGVTGYHTVLNSIRDFKETGEAEQLAAKRNSKLAILMKTIMGGAPTVNLFPDGGDNLSGTEKTNIEEVGDVATAYMFPNEEIKAHLSDRPSEGWRWLMEFQVRQIAMGMDLPFGVVWHMAGLGGPASRFEIGQANRVFCALLEDIIGPMWIRPTAVAWLANEFAQGRLPFNANWYKFKIPAPKSITIDLGRDSKAGIAENAAGLLPATDWYAEEDEDFEEQTDRIVYEARYREAARRGIPIEQVKEVPLEQIRIVTQQGNPSEIQGKSDPEQNPP